MPTSPTNSNFSPAESGREGSDYTTTSHYEVLVTFKFVHLLFYFQIGINQKKIKEQRNFLRVCFRKVLLRAAQVWLAKIARLPSLLGIRPPPLSLLLLFQTTSSASNPPYINLLTWSSPSSSWVRGGSRRRGPETTTLASYFFSFLGRGKGSGNSTFRPLPPPPPLTQAGTD